MVFDSPFNLREDVEPLFYGIKYKSQIKKIPLSIPISRFSVSGFVCTKCKYTLEMKCGECVPFLKYGKAFNLVVNFKAVKFPYMNLYFPAPCVFSEQVMKVYNYIMLHIHKYLRHLTFDIQPSDLKVMRETIQYRITRYYANILSRVFKYGKLTAMRGGKNSYIRKYVQACALHGTYLNIIIDTTLGPDEVLLPKALAKKIQSSILLCKRDPGINDLCCQPLKVRCYENNSSVKFKDYKNNTKFHEMMNKWGERTEAESRDLDKFIKYTLSLVHHDINSYFQLAIPPSIADGMHADQDGDAICSFYNVNNSSVYDLAAWYEILSNLFRHGRRVNMFNQLKYDFGQYFKLFIYRYDELIKQEMPLYASIRAPLKQKANILMTLISTIYYEQGVSVISQLIELSKKQFIFTTLEEMCNMSGIFEQIVDSGSKGSHVHLDIYRQLAKKRLRNGTLIDESVFFEQSTKQFDCFSANSASISDSGRETFILDQAYVDIIVKNNTLYNATTVLGFQFLDLDLTGPMVINIEVLDYIIQLYNN